MLTWIKLVDLDKIDMSKVYNFAISITNQNDLDTISKINVHDITIEIFDCQNIIMRNFNIHYVYLVSIESNITFQNVNIRMLIYTDEGGIECFF